MLGKLHLVRAAFDMRAVQPLDVLLIENGFHRLDCLKLRLELIDQVALEHTRVERRFIGVFLEDVPCAKDEIFDPGERHKIADHWHAVVGALA